MKNVFKAIKNNAFTVLALFNAYTVTKAIVGVVGGTAATPAHVLFTGVLTVLFILALPWVIYDIKQKVDYVRKR